MKKRLLLITFSILAVLVGINAQQIKRNLVANADFEDGLKHWRQYDDGGKLTFSEETADPVSGQKSAKIVVNNTATPIWVTALKYFFPMQSGAKYKVSFDAKASADVDLGIELTLPQGTDATNLSPEFTLFSTADQVYIGDTEQQSGSSVVDFTQAVSYRIVSTSPDNPAMQAESTVNIKLTYQ